MAESAQSQGSRPPVPGSLLIPSSAKKEGSLEEGAFGEGLGTSSRPCVCLGLLLSTGLPFPRGHHEATRPGSGWEGGPAGSKARQTELPPGSPGSVGRLGPHLAPVQAGAACSSGILTSPRSARLALAPVQEAPAPTSSGGRRREPGGLPQVAGFQSLLPTSPCLPGQAGPPPRCPTLCPSAQSPAPEREPGLCRPGFGAAACDRGQKRRRGSLSGRGRPAHFSPRGAAGRTLHPRPRYLRSVAARLPALCFSGAVGSWQ